MLVGGLVLFTAPNTTSGSSALPAEGIDQVAGRPAIERDASPVASTTAHSRRSANTAPHVAQSSAAQSSPAFSYGLSETWGDRPWVPAAGRFGEVSDIASAPDGTTWVLDGRGGAIHVLDTAGRPVRLLPLATSPVAAPWRARKLDVGAEGRVGVLATRRADDGRTHARVAIWAAGGTRIIGGFEEPLAFRDLALARGGRIVLVRTQPRVLPTPSRGPSERPAGGLDVYDAVGRLLASVERPALYLPVAVDVAETIDGERYFVANWLPSPEGIPPPGPAPTPRPSMADSLPSPPIGVRLSAAEISASTQSLNQTLPWQERAASEEGIVVFDEALTLRAFHPFYAPEDVGAGASGVFVGRASELWHVRADTRDPSAERPMREEPVAPFWSLPHAQINIPSYGPLLSVDVPEHAPRLRGALLVGVNHCQAQGTARFDAGHVVRRAQAIARGESPDGAPEWVGETDAPPLAGPFAPLRLAADHDGGLSVLQGRFRLDDPGAPMLPVTVGRWGLEPQSVQRWEAGRPTTQRGVCGDDPNWFERRHDGRSALDVAADGGRAFVAGPELVRARPFAIGKPWPDWTWWAGNADDDPPPLDAGSPLIGAVDARAGRIAVLDRSAGRVTLLDGDGAITARLPISDVLGGGIPVDLALGSDHVVVAESGGRVHVLGPAGSVEYEWDALDRILRIAVGPDDDVYVLGAGGWVERRHPSGDLRALWRLPGDGPPDVADIAVRPDGAVAVSFVFADPDDAGGPDGSESSLPPDSWRIVRAGIWLFRASAIDAPPATIAADGCWAQTDKTAAPAVLPLGDAITITLSVRVACPERRPPLHLLLVIDASRSMSWDGALERAQRLLGDVLAGLDAQRDSVSVIAYDAAPRLLVERSQPAEAARAMRALRAEGDTQLSAALTRAAQVATRSGAPNAGRSVALLVTDGVLRDHPQAEADALREAGAAVHALVLPHPDFDALRRRNIELLAGGSENVHEDLDVARGEQLLRALTGASVPAAQGRIASWDALPGDMSFLAGSPVPRDATWDEAVRQLDWPDRSIPPGALTWTIGARPLQVGLRPTNRVAGGTWAVGGEELPLAFPVPRVKVWDRASLKARAYLPATVVGACLRPDPLAVVLVLDGSRSMDEPFGPGGASKLEAARSASHALLAGLAPVERIGLVTFSAEARIAADLGASRPAVRAALDALATAPGTRIDLALRAATAMLAARRPSEHAVVIVLTDGKHDGDVAVVRSAADALTQSGRPGETAPHIWTVAVGPTADRALLRAIATDGATHDPGDPASLGRLFAAFGERLRCTGDAIDGVSP